MWAATARTSAAVLPGAGCEEACPNILCADSVIPAPAVPRVLLRRPAFLATSAFLRTIPPDPSGSHPAMLEMAKASVFRFAKRQVGAALSVEPASPDLPLFARENSRTFEAGLASRFKTALASPIVARTVRERLVGCRQNAHIGPHA